MPRGYLVAGSIQEALNILHSCKGRARVIAGGTDLVPELKEGTREVDYLIDISEIEPLKQVEEDDNNVKIGAGVTHSQAASSDIVQSRGKVLAEAASTVGCEAIRNQGTVAGNVVNAQPAADAAVALFALDARAEITTTNDSRLIPVDQLYEGPGLSKVDSSNEIVTAIHFTGLAPNYGSAFIRLARRRALTLASVNVAVVVEVVAGHFEDVRIVAAPVARMPLRLRKAEAALTSTASVPESISNAADIAVTEAQPRDSILRGSAEYRKEIVRVLVARGIETAVRRSVEGTNERS